ncbi:MAG: hypothetical protein COA58_06770 [Bacteroidetes bacterium]|nr:MAG: hypothetical protein COA58_06770 [Bacteroidota bacterium]
MKDYYETLGLKKGCNSLQIKKAYRKLSLKLHPDVNKNANAHDTFIEINEAYQVLRDPVKRSKYNYLLKNHKNILNAKRQKRYENSVNRQTQKGNRQGKRYAQEDDKSFQKKYKWTDWMLWSGYVFEIILWTLQLLLEVVVRIFFGILAG